MADQIPKLPSKIDATSTRFEKNMRAMAELVAAVRNEEQLIQQGGGEKAIESQHAKKRLTAREREGRGSETNRQRRASGDQRDFGAREIPDETLGAEVLQEQVLVSVARDLVTRREAAFDEVGVSFGDPTQEEERRARAMAI